ncbi:MAG: D-alanyl-D-alanine carboxypeptidase family protein, partial [Xanthomonadales bacterium]|nr:D-alanyl-D-alanine carboxypeptidase family protein [Xanthomonadales bacterium]
AFAWLTAHAKQFGFRMSFPRGNPHGVAYEPWHWAWRG